MSAERPPASDAELAILKLLWESEPLSARDIREQLYPGGSQSDNATVQKLLQRLEQKKLVTRDRRSFAHLFRSTATREELAGEQLEVLASKLTDGSMVPFILHAVNTKPLTTEERKEIRRLLDRRNSGREAIVRCAMPSLMEIGLINAALAAVLAAIVWLVTRVVRNPVLVHTLWVIVLLKLVTPPFVSIPWSYTERTSYSLDFAGSSPEVATRDFEPAPILSEANASQPAGIINAIVPPETVAIPVIAMPDSADARGLFDGQTIRQQASRAWLTISPGTVAAVWVSGSAICLFVSVIRMTRFHSALAGTTPAPPAMCDLADRVAARLGVSRHFRLRITEGRLPPLVWPIGRPTIVLSRPLVAELSPGETETLLAHEFAHLRRKDHWVRWLEMAATVIYWWNPVVWWSRAIIHKTEELACDAWVVRAFPEAAKRYASALFTAMQFVSDSHSTPPLVASRLDVVGNFKERIENIMSGNCDRRLSFLHKLSVLVLAIFVLPLSLRVVRAAEEAAKPEGAAEITSDLDINQASTRVSATLPSSGPYSVESSTSNVEKEIERQLQTPVKLDYIDAPLAEVMHELENSVGIDIHFDKVGLDQEGISPEEPVTIDLKNKVSLRSALNLILKPFHLTFAIEDEVLKITNEKRPPTTVAQVPVIVSGVTVADPFANNKRQAEGEAVPQSPASESRLSTRVWKKIVASKKQSYERLQELAKNNVIPAAELEQAQNDYEINVAKYEQALRALKYNQLLVQLAEIEYQEALAANKTVVGSVNDLELRKLQIKVELANAKLSELGD